MKKLILAMVAVVAMAGCGGGGGGSTAADTAAPAPTITAENNKAAYDAAVAPLNSLYARWKDAQALAGNTPRLTLSGPIASMQTLKQEASALVVAKCLQIPKNFLTLGMSQIIDGYLAFMSLNDASSTSLIASGNNELVGYEQTLAAQTTCDFTILQ